MQIRRRFVWAGVALVAIVVVGTIGYWFVWGRQHSFLDALYMAIITIATIGYGEVVDMSHNPAGRIFTIFIALLGIGTLSYVLTSFAALMVEGDLTQSFKRRKMEKLAMYSKDHYIVCGAGEMGFHIVRELRATQKDLVVVDINKGNLERILEAFQDQVYVEGDATDNNTLLRAGIKQAKGVFAVTGDDNQNLVVSLTAKQLSPNVRVVARCHLVKNSEKMTKAGADAVVSPSFIGGLRMASEMIRPTVVSFLDMMLRDEGMNKRVEETPVPPPFVGRSIADLNIREIPNMLLLAVRTGERWLYNPPDDYVIRQGTTLIIMATPEGKIRLERSFSAKG